VGTENNPRQGTYITTSVIGESVQAFIPPALALVSFCRDRLHRL